MMRSSLSRHLHSESVHVCVCVCVCVHVPACECVCVYNVCTNVCVLCMYKCVRTFVQVHVLGLHLW